MSLKERAKRLKRDIPVIMLCLRSPETPLPAKLLAGLTVAYALSPIDLIPDFIPVLGYLDDLLLLPALIALTVRLIPRELIEKKRAEAIALEQNGGQKRWYYALPIVLIWLLIVALIVRAILRA